MNKSLNKILISSVSLLMLLSAGISNVNAKHVKHPRITQIRKRRIQHSHKKWYRGTPNILHKRSYWVSNYLHIKLFRYFPYSRYEFSTNSRSGIELFRVDYKNKHSKGIPGTGTSAFDVNYPYYQNLGHGRYLMTSGDSGVLHKHSHLYYDLEDGAYLMKEHGNNHLSLWHISHYNLKHHNYHGHYMGFYTRYSHSDKELKKVLNWKEL